MITTSVLHQERVPVAYCGGVDDLKKSNKIPKKATSALPVASPYFLSHPPATNTLPLGNKVVVWPILLFDICFKRCQGSALHTLMVLSEYVHKVTRNDDPSLNSNFWFLLVLGLLQVSLQVDSFTVRPEAPLQTHSNTSHPILRAVQQAYRDCTLSSQPSLNLSNLTERTYTL